MNHELHSGCLSARRPRKASLRLFYLFSPPRLSAQCAESSSTDCLQTDNDSLVVRSNPGLRGRWGENITSIWENISQQTNGENRSIGITRSGGNKLAWFIRNIHRLSVEAKAWGKSSRFVKMIDLFLQFFFRRFFWHDSWLLLQISATIQLLCRDSLCCCCGKK